MNSKLMFFKKLLAALVGLLSMALVFGSVFGFADIKDIGRVITKNVEEVTTKVADATTGFVEKNGPAVKVAGALLSAAQINKGRKSKKKAE